MGFKLSLNEGNKEYLIKEEIQQILDKNFKIERLAQVRDVFILCCYTGLSYADVQRLTINDIQLGMDGELWIMVTRKKLEYSPPLLPEASSLVIHSQDE